MVTLDKSVKKSRRTPESVQRRFSSRILGKSSGRIIGGFLKKHRRNIGRSGNPWKKYSRYLGEILEGFHRFSIPPRIATKNLSGIPLLTPRAIHVQEFIRNVGRNPSRSSLNNFKRVSCKYIKRISWKNLYT